MACGLLLGVAGKGTYAIGRRAPSQSFGGTLKKSVALFSISAVLFVASSCAKDPVGISQQGVNDSVPLNFALTPAQISESCSAGKKAYLGAVDAVAATPLAEVTFGNTLLRFETASAEFTNALTPVTFLKYVSTDSKVRTAADDCETMVSQLSVDLYVREDLFKVLKTLSDQKGNLNAIDQKLLDETLSGFRRNGLELPADRRAIYVSKKKALVKLEADFSTNLNEYQDTLVVTKAELDGMPESFINSLGKTEDGKYKLSMAYPHYYPVMENAKNVEVRKQFEAKFNKRGGLVNRDLLEKAVSLRHELATMLGFKSHAQFVLEKRMAKSPEQVDKFLKDLIAKLIPVGRSNLAEMLDLKREELKDPTISTINAWDWRYYDVQLKKKKFNIDTQKIKEFFPLATVNAGLFEIYQTLLGVEFKAAPELPRWHESVLPYRVTKNGKTVAYFYMDLFPRAGKYGHAAAFTLLGGYLQADRNYRAPISSIVANFNAPSDGKPSLLQHSEVETLFHEFGHIMHQVLTTASYQSFSGTAVSRDFVEAPSQMLESWVWETVPLAKVSGHYLNPAEKLPEETVKKLIAAKNLDAGIKYLRQAAFATLDLEYHNSGGNVDTTAVYAKAMRDVMLIPIQDGTYPQASFGHLMGGYDSAYYGYLWSEVYAADMYTRFAAEGLLNPQTGADYRKWILEPGGTQDAFALLRGFLGRDPNQTAFLQSLGLGE